MAGRSVPRLGGHSDGPGARRAGHDHAVHERRWLEGCATALSGRRTRGVHLGAAQASHNSGPLRQGGGARHAAAALDEIPAGDYQPDLVARRTADRVRARGREPGLDLSCAFSGGQERKLVDVSRPVRDEGDELEPNRRFRGRPTESRCFTPKRSAGSRIVRLSLATLNEPLTSPPIASSGDAFERPDGRRLAFVRSHSRGVNRIRLLARGRPEHLGERCRRHTPHPAHELHRPLRDAALVAGRPPALFDSLQSGNWDVYVVDLEGSTPRNLLTRDPSEDTMGTWSRDGRFVYLGSSRSGSRELWRVPAEGGAPLRLTHAGAHYGIESADGRFVYYTNRSRDAGIWRIPASGGEPVEIVRGPLSPENFALGARGLYYIEGRSGLLVRRARSPSSTSISSPGR